MTQPVQTYGMTDLGYLILLDRYALKTRGKVNIGDLVIAIVDNESNDMGQKRELAHVVSFSDKSDYVYVELTSTGELKELHINLLDVPLETTPEQVQARVAHGIASVEKTEELQQEWQNHFQWLLDDWKFVPGGRILASAGTDQRLSSYNCFVIPSPKDSRGGIMKTLTDMAEIMSRGGGVGINVSTLRPKNAPVAGVNGRSSGAVSWAALYSYVTGLIEQAGSRRGALMLILNDWHPDLLRFINSKKTAGNITNANISVGISDAFMQAVEDDAIWKLRFPDTKHPAYGTEWHGDLEAWEAKGYPSIVYDTVKARDIWNAIIESAWASAEPGLWFRDRANSNSNSYYYDGGQLIATNPCVIGSTQVLTSEGYICAKDLKAGMNLVVPGKSGHHEEYPIAKVYNNGVQPIWKVTTNNNELFCTADHRLMVLVSDDETSNRYDRETAKQSLDNWTAWVKVDDLVPGDVVFGWDNKEGLYFKDIVTNVMQTETQEEVFDIYEPNRLIWVTNNLISLDCGEEPLPGWAVCNLGALNLSKFVVNGGVDWNNLKTAVYYAVRFLDDVIDWTPYFMSENEAQQKNERRVGLGIMGLAEMLIKCGVRYGADDGVALTSEVFQVIAEEAYSASSEIAVEKGAFPLYDRDAFLNSGYMNNMLPAIRNQVYDNGIRNVTLLTVAPTGCVAPDTLISANDSLLKIANMGDVNGDQWQDIDASVMTDDGLKSASKFYINGMQSVKKITTKRGFSITATLNHRIRVIDEITGDYVWRRMDEIKDNDTVVLWRNTLKGNPEIELKQLDKAKHFNAVADMPTILTPAFARLLGLYIGDGYITKRGGLNIVVNDNDQDVIEKIRLDAKQVFNAEIRIEQRVGCKVVIVNSRDMARFFELNGLLKPKGNYGQGARGAFIPDVILQSGRICLAAFLSGLFDSDGSIYSGKISLASTSEVLIKQVQVALLSLGMASHIDIHRNRLDSYGKNPIYNLRLVNIDEVQIFKREIGFVSHRKNERLFAKMVKSARGESIEVQPAIDEFYKSSKALPTAIRQKIAYSIENESLNVDFVREKVQSHPQLKQSIIGKLALHGAFFDTVKSIENGECNTYDISVPEGNTYIANGFVSHNTTGTMVNTSTGIEPFFSWVYYRRGRLGLHEERIPLLTEWLTAHSITVDENGNSSEPYTLPPEFVTAMDLTPVDHVRMQAAAQRWVDAAISKTVNVPNDFTIEDTAKLYQLMYEWGCKGGTIYRDGSRSEQVLILKPTTETTVIESPVKSVIPVDKSEIDFVPAPLHIEKRGAHLNGQTYKGHTPYGNVFVTVNEDDNGNPFEIFVVTAKSGSDLAAQGESIGRLLSVTLQMLLSDHRVSALTALVEQLRGIGGSKPYGFGQNRVASFPDAVAKILDEQYLKKRGWERSAQGESLAVVVENSFSDVPVYVNVNSELAYVGSVDLADGVVHLSTNGHKALVSGDNVVIPFANTCPECHNTSLLRQDGCEKCDICGYSVC